MKKKDFGFGCLVLALCCSASLVGSVFAQEVRAPERIFIFMSSPNGGEQILRRGQFLIQWRTGGDVGRPTIEIRKGGSAAQTFTRVDPIGPLAGNLWRWTWNVSDGLVPGDDYRVRIISENGRTYGESANPFSIVDAKIEVYMPRAGDHFHRHSTMTIHFRTFGLGGNLRVFQEGYPGYPIAINVPHDQGIVEWRNVGCSTDGMILFPTGNRIVVETMAHTVRGYSHAYTLEE